jgi:hypothetical protein
LKYKVFKVVSEYKKMHYLLFNGTLRIFGILQPQKSEVRLLRQGNTHNTTRDKQYNKQKKAALKQINHF